MKNLILFCIFFLFVLFTFAQTTFIPTGSNAYHLLDRQEILAGSLNTYYFTSTKPYSRKVIGEFYNSFFYDPEVEVDVESGYVNKKGVLVGTYNTQYLINESAEWSIFRSSLASKKPILKHFYKSPAAIYEVNEENFILKINPVLYIQGGTESNASEFQYINTKGLELRGCIDEKIGFYTFLTDNQAVYPSYVRDRIARDDAVPGQGFYKPFKTSGVDFLNARGYIDFSVTEHVNVQFGHDKNFIGNGYRSLFLSDFSNNYFFLKLNTKIWKLNYQNLFTELIQEHATIANIRYPKKYASIHHLSTNITKWLNIGLFESVVFGTLEANYFNPIIFFRSVEQNLGSPDNSILGLDFKVNMLKHFSWYGQFLLDEFNINQFRDYTGWWGNKYGFQTGLKYIDVAGISNLDAQIEYNVVRPYTYTHLNSDANYTHYNQPLAHPLGANFSEWIGIVRFQPRPKVNFTGKVIAATYGADTAGSNWGGNVLLDYITREQDYYNKVGQGVKTNLLLADILFSYQWKHNIFFDLRLIYRQTSDIINGTQSTQIVSAGFRMNIAPVNFDF